MGSKGDDGKVTFEEALDKAGFGLYSYIVTSFAGFVVISYSCIAYGTTFTIPTSACELETTTAQQGFMAAAPYVGLVLGAILWGYIGDVFGRRTPLMISLLSAAAVNIVASLSVNWIMLMILQFLGAFLNSGQYPLAMAFVGESVPMAKRNSLVIFVTSIAILCQAFMAVIAMPIAPLTFSIYLPSLGIYWNSWRTLMVVYSLPSVIAAIWLLFMKESPKYLYIAGRESDALDVLATIHKVNMRKTSKEFAVTGIIQDDTKQKPSSKKKQIVPLFKLPLLKYTIVMTTLFVFQLIGTFVIWLPTVANQLFRILETGEGRDLSICDILDASKSVDVPVKPDVAPCSINFSALVLVLSVGGLQSFFNLLIALVVNRFGRRNLAVFVTGVCGVCGLLSNLVPNALGSVILFVVFLNGFVIMGLYTAMVVALFPTSVRAFAMAFTSTGGRIGSFAAIQILNLMLTKTCNAGFYLYAAIFTSSAIVILLFIDDDRRPRHPNPLHDKSEENPLEN